MIAEIVQQARGISDTQDVNPVVLRAHNYIRMNFDRDITASKVAQAVGYNADYLGRIYRQCYGCTLTEAIHRRRISKARYYLLNSEFDIGQIALQCGFNNENYFRRIFKRHMKVTPGDYRVENAPMHVVTH